MKILKNFLNMIKKKKRLGRVFRNNKENDLWVKRDLMLEYFDKNF